jgi:malonyl-ACP O-methyltransferase BioC
MNENVKIFDRKRLRYHRERAAQSFSSYDFLIQEAAERLSERLDDTTRTFPIALDLGCHTGQFQSSLQGRGGIDTLIQCDLSEAMTRQTSGIKLVADEEYLPFAPNSFDLVVSTLSLHWVNDLPGTLAQIRHILKPDGVLIASFLGGTTLKELRQSVLSAGSAEGSGVSPRVIPFVDVKDAGALLQRAGFSMPVADSDILTVTYPDALSLMKELRGMGESNVLVRSQKSLTTPQTLFTITQHYQQLFETDTQEIPATFEIITVTGMKASQRPQKH